MTATMRAVYLVGERQLEIHEVPVPEAPEDGLILDVKACGVCGSDLRRWREGPPKSGEDVLVPGYQKGASGGVVPGHEVTGVVAAVGARVRGYAPGDRLAIAPDIHCGVCFFCRRGMYNLCDDPRYLGITPGYAGGLADKMVLTHEALTRGIVHRIPDSLSFVEAALSEPCSSVLATHHKAGTSFSDVVVVIGAGPTGCMHIAIARARGARVIVSQRSAPRREMARRFGPEAVVDPSSEDLAAVVGSWTEGRGADLVICANPVASTQALAVEIVRKGGRVVLFGGLPKAKPMTTLDSNRIHYGEIEVVGAFSYHPRFHQLALDVLARKIVPADLLVTHTFSLDQVCAAFETAASGQGLKVVVTAA
jgi:L-iditol 2-dehydrogenase